jgi:predicted MPP superfamily phosphohydrolase
VPATEVTAPVVPWLLGAAAVAAITHLYLWLRLQRGPAWRGPLAIVLAPFAALLPAGMCGLLYMRVLPRALARPLMALSFTYLGFLFFLLAILVLLDAASLVAAWRPALRRLRAPLALLSALGLSSLALTQVLRAPRLERHLVSIASWPPSLSGYRVVQLSDLHVGAMLGASFVDDLVGRTNALHPDLVVLTGDLVDGAARDLAVELEPLRRLRARDGVYVVLGNHEYLSGADEWAEAFSRLGLHVLRNQGTVIRDAIELIGLDDAVTGPDGHPAADLDRAFASHVAGRPSLLLAHEPQTAAQAIARGASLQLSGHTHGGQIFPMHLLAWLDQGYLAGLYRVGSGWLYVNRGAGFWGPPMRMGAPAEIALLIVSP